MRFRDGDVGWLVAYLLLGGFFIFAVLHFPFVRDIACEPKETSCFREWASALSGWFGAVAAFATIIFIIRQIDEQKRQTDFVLGDALPTMDVTIDLDDERQKVVRIVNWNRRGILVRSVKTNFDANLGIVKIKHNGSEIPLPKLRWPMTVYGWEDRIKRGPEILQLKIFVIEDEEVSTQWPSDAEVTVIIQIFGDKHQIKELTAAVYP
jgi:hypothetical protein